MALPGVLLLALFLVSVSGWLLGHVRTNQELAWSDVEARAVSRAADAGVAFSAQGLAGIVDWHVLDALSGALACPATGAPVTAVDAAQESSTLQASTNARSRWGSNTPQWRLLLTCHAPGVLGNWRDAARAPALLVWVADDPETDGDPLQSANQRLLLRAQASGSRGLRAEVTATVARTTPGAPVTLEAWREGAE